MSTGGWDASRESPLDFLPKLTKISVLPYISIMQNRMFFWCSHRLNLMSWASNVDIPEICTVLLRQDCSSTQLTEPQRKWDLALGRTHIVCERWKFQNFTTRNSTFTDAIRLVFPKKGISNSTHLPVGQNISKQRQRFRPRNSKLLKKSMGIGRISVVKKKARS